MKISESKRTLKKGMKVETNGDSNSIRDRGFFKGTILCVHERCFYVASEELTGSTCSEHNPKEEKNSWFISFSSHGTIRILADVKPDLAEDGYCAEAHNAFATGGTPEIKFNRCSDCSWEGDKTEKDCPSCGLGLTLVTL